MNELTREQIKQERAHQELNELGDLLVGNLPQSVMSNLSSPILFKKFRRFSSAGMPDMDLAENALRHRSFNVLCETPDFQPPSIIITDYSETSDFVQ